MSCTKADALLARGGHTARETVNAKKTRIGPRDLERVLEGAKRVIASKGANVRTFDLAKIDLQDKEFLAAVIGPTGNLRAPTLRLGKTALIGFHQETWKEQLG